MTRAVASTFELVRGAVYLSPCGRACRLALDQGTADAETEALLVYDTPTGGQARGAMADGFLLARKNWHLLRRLT